MTKAAFTRTLSGTLAPLDAVAVEFMGRLKAGDVARVEVVRARNPRRFRLFWGLVGVCMDNTDTHLSKEAWADYLKILAGHVEVVKRRGEVIKLPKSIAFGSLPEAEFSEFMSRLMDAVRTEIIPGLPEADLRRELEEIAGLKENTTP